MTSILLYAVATTFLLALVGVFAERIAEMRGWPRRWTWVLVLAIAVGCLVTMPWRHRATTAVPLPSTSASVGTAAPAALVRTGRSPAPAAHGAEIPTHAPAVHGGDSRDVSGDFSSIDVVIRSVWIGASLILLLAYLTGSGVLAIRRRRWRAARVDGAPVLIAREDGPAVLGILRPAIVLPEWALRIDPQPRALMVEHELEHIRARDPLVVHGGLIALLLMPWNVGLWWMVQRLRLATELDCDARVIRRGAAADLDIATYSDLLLSVAERRSFAYFRVAPALVERHSSLRRRLVAMYPHQFQHPALQGGLAAAAIVALLALTAATPAPSRQSTWRIDPEPIFDVGAKGQDTLDSFDEVVGSARLPNGDVVVADGKNLALRYFAPTGRFRRSVGRRGDGPGEFQRIRRMLHCGDSLYVMQLDTGQWSVFSKDGAFARTFTLAMPRSGSEYPYNSQCNRSGLVISHDWAWRTEPAPGNFRVMVPFWISNPDGSIKTRLGDFPGDDRFTTLDREGRPSGAGPLPLGKQPVLGLGRERAYIGSADSFAIVIYDLVGKPVGMIRKPNVDVRTTAADIERFWTLDTAGKSDADRGLQVKDLKDAVFPKTIPAYASLIVDSDDNVWVQSYPRPAEKASHWAVFSSAGAAIASIDLPANLNVTEVGHDYVLGISLELPDGVHHVKVFRLNRGTRQ
jgi:beta-lactamase regulating signal transducer with metallopeptidase domain